MEILIKAKPFSDYLFTFSTTQQLNESYGWSRGNLFMMMLPVPYTKPAA